MFHLDARSNDFPYNIDVRICGLYNRYSKLLYNVVLLLIAPCIMLWEHQKSVFLCNAKHTFSKLCYIYLSVKQLPRSSSLWCTHMLNQLFRQRIIKLSRQVCKLFLKEVIKNNCLRKSFMITFIKGKTFYNVRNIFDVRKNLLNYMARKRWMMMDVLLAIFSKIMPILSTLKSRFQRIFMESLNIYYIDSSIGIGAKNEVFCFQI